MSTRIAGACFGAALAIASLSAIPAQAMLQEPTCQWSAESNRKIVAFGYGDTLTVKLRHGRKLTAEPRYQVEGRNVWIVKVPRGYAEDDIRRVSVDHRRCEPA
jgi:hypothetical protein